MVSDRGRIFPMLWRRMPKRPTVQRIPLMWGAQWRPISKAICTMLGDKVDYTPDTLRFLSRLRTCRLLWYVLQPYSCLDSPKSDIFTTSFLNTRIFLAARSPWTIYSRGKSLIHRTARNVFSCLLFLCSPVSVPSTPFRWQSAHTRHTYFVL